jgi:hypothetical protein
MEECFEGWSRAKKVIGELLSEKNGGRLDDVAVVIRHFPSLFACHGAVLVLVLVLVRLSNMPTIIVLSMGYRVSIGR